jgi:hypothetical protein
LCVKKPAKARNGQPWIGNAVLFPFFAKIGTRVFFAPLYAKIVMRRRFSLEGTFGLPLESNG